MTGHHQTHGDLDGILGFTWHLLLDFDGPICDVYAGLPAATVAGRLRKHLHGQDVTVPDEVAHTDDPLAVFAYAATISPTLAAEVEAEMSDLEVTAIATAKPTPYVHEVLDACRETDRTAAVVSNNSARAVHTYLARHGLDDRVSHVIARTSHDPALLKPSPHLIKQALAALNAQPDACAFLGDSTTDIQGACLTGIASIGYASKPSKRDQLATAGADAIITSLSDLVLSLRIKPLPR
jgi:phosphoglycolate phosphatase